jgi:3',5'-cyclic AMP phosphodiesterase CpdA
MIRVAHVSDVHLTATRLGLTFADFLGKRIGTWANMRFRRRRAFRLADEVIQAFERDRVGRGVGHVLFSGDATNYGLKSEMERAAELLAVDRVPGLAVPGNHDYLTAKSAASGDFERCFAPWQTGRRIGEHAYPFAQELGGVWFVAVNSARPNRWSWDASGEVGADQSDRLRRLLAELSPAPRILVTHYPIALENGLPEPANRRLKDLDTVLAIARDGGVRCWLHGHRHRFYHLPNPLASGIHAVCIGSSTQRTYWSYGDYTITPQSLSAVRRIYDPETNAFADGGDFTVRLT